VLIGTVTEKEQVPGIRLARTGVQLGLEQIDIGALVLRQGKALEPAAFLLAQGQQGQDTSCQKKHEGQGQRVIGFLPQVRRELGRVKRGT
jgi:hypothetical protein